MKRNTPYPNPGQLLQQVEISWGWIAINDGITNNVTTKIDDVCLVLSVEAALLSNGNGYYATAMINQKVYWSNSTCEDWERCWKVVQ